jgi:Mrp family chromosome partitioning ATPase
MSRLVANAASRFDWVIVDSPPAAGLADARIISETVHGVVLVVRAGVTRFPDLEASANALGPDRILGIVLNAADPGEIRRDDYYSHYYGEGRE